MASTVGFIERFSWPMGFDAYMQAALYDPEVGFYATGGRAGGHRGDFITSPEVGPLFGAVVSRYVDACWRDAGSPDQFVVAEAGAGPGTLARSIAAAEPDCREALRWLLVESSPAQRAQHHDLPPMFESSAAQPDRADLVFANELLDNLPVRVARHDGSTWHEVGVAPDQTGGLSSVLLGPLDSADPAAELLDALVPSPRPGTEVPIMDAAAEWVTQATRTAPTVVAIDYAATTAELAARAERAFMRTYRDHTRGHDPLVHPGGHDITVDVAVDQLPEPTRTTTQADWLGRHGIGELVAEGRRIWSERAGIGDLVALRARSRIVESEALLDPSGLGAFTVLEWHRH